MNPRDHEETAWSDAEFDALLTAFFRNEMPHELRTLPEPTAPQPTVSGRPRHQAGAYGLLAAASLGLLWAGAALWSPRTSPTDVAQVEEKPSNQASRVEQSMPPANGLDSRSPATRVLLPEESPPVLHQFVGDGLEPTERVEYQTSQGPVEQRTGVRWTPVSVRDAASGNQVEIMLPEVMIEVYPLEFPPERPQPDRLAPEHNRENRDTRDPTLN
jgi:hypothetical protein